MEINIESSLAAMAFVVADQQDTIKQYREERSTWQRDMDVVNAKLTAKIEELGRCETEIRLLHDEIDELKVSCAAKEIEANEFKRDVDALSVELEQNRIQWRDVDPETSGTNIAIIVPPEVLDRQAIIIVKNKVIVDGITTVDYKPLVVGSYFLTVGYAQRGNDGGYYITFVPNQMSEPVQYAVVPCLAEKEVFDV